MALTKAQALALSEPVEKMYMDCASQLIINISKHFATGRGLATQAWEAQKLAEMGQLTDEAIEIIAVNTGQKAEEVRKALYDGIKIGLADEEALLQNAAENGYVATAGGTLETSMQVRNLVDAYAAQADDQLNLVNTVMLQSTQNRYMLAIQQVISAEEAAKIEMLTSAKNAAELAVQMGKAQNVLNAATGSVLLGNEARTKALRGAIKTLADEGITGFIDAGGHHWTPEAYVNMDIRTTVGNVARQAQKARAAEYGVDTFQVSSHAAARPLCAPYQGWICSWSGGGYTVEDLYGNSYMVHDIKETSYGEPAGLFGINCGHNPLTFVPGYSVPRVAELTPEQEQENALQYAQSQQQRHLEREVRHAKTEALAYEAAGDKEGFALAAAKVKQTQADYMAFCNATDRTPRTDRLQVFGYNRSVSGKATAATKGFKPVPKVPKAATPVAKAAPAAPVAPVRPALTEKAQQIVDNLKANNVVKNDVKPLPEKLTTEQIIARVGGGDTTKGSCVSCAWAYAGNKGGYDVLDFRGGDSRSFFARRSNTMRITELDGVVSFKAQHTNDFTAVHELFKHMEEGKEYVLTTGSHGAVIRLKDGVREYLELQSGLTSGYTNGFYPLDDKALKWRFACKRSHSFYGEKYAPESLLIDIDSLKGNNDFTEILGYINTAAENQQKSISGSIK